MSAHKKQHLEKAKSLKGTEAALRDQFAMAALPALCHGTVAEGACEDVATRAYQVADAMLTAREPPPEEDATQPLTETKG